MDHTMILALVVSRHHTGNYTIASSEIQKFRCKIMQNKDVKNRTLETQSITGPLFGAPLTGSTKEMKAAGQTCSPLTSEMIRAERGNLCMIPELKPV